jgi:carboxypeptidase Q
MDYKNTMRRTALWTALLAGSAALTCAAAQAEAPAAAPSVAVEAATLAKIREAALQSDWAYQRLADLTDLIGPRLSGSPGAAAAVKQVADAMQKAGAEVSLQAVKVPHWVRGQETAQLVDYPGRPAGLSQRVVLTALGGSGATPAAGLTAPVLVVHSMEELAARAAEVKGRIVLFDVAYDQNLADAGMSGAAYGQAGLYRFAGPLAAARLGAAAALVRSVGGADFRIPHTGATHFSDGLQIPAAAVTAEDAMLMTRLDARGPIKLHLTLTPQTLPDADSFNVIAEIRGSEKPDEIVIVSGHLDSWDLATGAIDDGAGLVGARGALETIKRLHLQPKRTIRVIAWMNEENGSRGGQTYTANNRALLGRHFAAIESDSGAGRPLGLLTSIGADAVGLFKPLQAALLPLGAAALTRRDVLGTGDLSDIERGGVPIFEPLLDNRTYFNYHHTPADTLDKVVPDNVRRQVALMGMLSWYLANMPEPIGRAASQKP